MKKAFAVLIVLLAALTLCAFVQPVNAAGYSHLIHHSCRIGAGISTGICSRISC